MSDNEGADVLDVLGYLLSDMPFDDAHKSLFVHLLGMTTDVLSELEGSKEELEDEQG